MWWNRKSQRKCLPKIQCEHKNNTWTSIPVGDSETEIFGITCNDCGVFIACKLWGEESVAHDIEERFEAVLKTELKGLRRELATLTKDAKLAAFEAKMTTLDSNMCVLREEFSALENKIKKLPTVEEALDRQFDILTASLDSFGQKFLAKPKPSKKPKPKPKPKSKKKKRS